jgi:hypothetical protein
MTDPTEQDATGPVDFVLHGSIDRHDNSAKALFDWLRTAPIEVILNELQVAGENIDLQSFETLVDNPRG